MANNQYKVEGSTKRKHTYSIAIVAGALVLAAAITAGYITMDQVEGFIDLTVRLVGVLGGLITLVVAALARKNVDPPVTGNSTGTHIRWDTDAPETGRRSAE